ncbi:PucR family transcriptional regulator [Evansella cellulosilytica]|uniref:Putative transcriptional regulator, PucR family n=1 Tax=Evansella cellulosilytica (strain ATCC 21833 / DSM 2522 / FERM P-1141 / JCM 9156 / N-4) TaxID=649639 RepID=E6TX26_EVAC2|nr:helix-turn-helix domain-containing protein [Evansella cellulosilytica]ADU31115.1 putative transcriptional regulator, PucR family [Evansella cellulosilytica DSM 2522]
MMKKEQKHDPFKKSFGSLENLVDKISDVLSCPVTIEDANHNLLVYSSHDERTDQARIATIIGRRVPEKVINQFWKNGILPKLLETNNPVRVPEIIDMGISNRVAISIKANNDILGFIWVLEINKQLSDNDLALLKMAAETARNQLLQRQVRKQKQTKGYQEFFWQLLTGHLTSTEEIVNKFDQLEIIPPSSFFIVIFSFNHDITLEEERHISYLLTISQQIRTVFYVIDGNELILLSTTVNDNDFDINFSSFLTNFTSQMKKKFSIDDIISGAGNKYNKYENIETSYQQAITVLNLKKQYPDELIKTHTYEKLGIFRYIEFLQQKNKVDNYYNQAILNLESYDQNHNTHLLHTLDTFLSMDSNVNEAANQLHIHTNTLLYRLKRISEVGKINLKNMNEKTSLFVDMKLYKLSKQTHL